MEVRKYNPSDYFTVASWWSKQKWPVIPSDHLPEHGFIVDGIAAGFLYKTDSKFALLEFVIANPDTSKEDRSKALDLVIDSLLKSNRPLISSPGIY